MISEQIPIRHILMLSGGKDSTALALYMRDKYPDIEMEYLFTDTHKELPETYEYLTKIEAYLGKPVHRVSSKKGERGFDHFLKMFRGFLPSPQARWCTKELKIKPFERFVGDEPVKLYVGIRADEKRDGYISTKPNITPVFPFKEDGVTKEDVMRILDESGVGMPGYYSWRSRSGCYFCFYQRKSEWVGLKERHPDLFESAKSYERIDEGYTWVEKESLIDIEKPERMLQIVEREAIRIARNEANRGPRTLAEIFTGEIGDDDDDQGGCLICHL